MTWHQIMTYAHTGIELKNIPGVTPNPPPGTLQIPVASATTTPPTETAPRPPVLTRRGADILTRIERLMDDAARALVVADAPAAPVPEQSTQRPGSAVAETVAGRPRAVSGN
jgi:penicillin-binding protein 1A